VLEATKLIKAGKIYRLGINLEPGIPLFGQRHLSITIPGGPTSGPFGDQKLMFNDEMLNGEIGQVGSQFDGLGMGDLGRLEGGDCTRDCTRAAG
jgi:hypothetical protein